MNTLKLKRDYRATYSAEGGNIRIQISNPYKSIGMGTDGWQLIIEVDDKEVYNDWFTTKRHASIAGAEWVMNVMQHTYNLSK